MRYKLLGTSERWLGEFVAADMVRNLTMGGYQDLIDNHRKGRSL